MPNDKTVWSSEQGDLRKKDQAPADLQSVPRQQQTIYLHRESAGRGGKAVTSEPKPSQREPLRHRSARKGVPLTPKVKPERMR